MTIAVLGGAGYIGSHTVKYLRAAGIPLAVYDNFSTGFRESLPDSPELPVVSGDIGDAERLAHFLRQHQITAVLHLAALSVVAESFDNPRRYYHNNFVATQTLLDTLLTCDIRQLVFSSTCAIYGKPRQLPLTEEHPCQPDSPYGCSKLAVEHLLADYARAYGLRYVSLRYFNASGADPDGELGERHQPETHLIPLLLERVRQQQNGLNPPPFTIFGDDYPTPDGTCIRDYVHVWDLAQAHQLALDYVHAGGASNIFNLGQGQGYSVREVIQMAEAVTGEPIPVAIAPRRSGDTPVLYGSGAKAAELLGWRPAYTDLHSILTSAWRWHRQ
ncbi:MAG: UDP-glucose 4-epimerase GalE [Candidatus Sericytochromatia bacterium]|nr:UDP-glucose 4-epimerase GalE [Candidatus Sericytochromatia bacterium]